MKNNRQSNEMQGPNSSSNCIVSIQDCEVIADLKKEFEITGPASQLTLFHSDGTTGIDVGDSPADCLNGNSPNNPLIVCSIPNAIPMNAGPIWKVYGTIGNSLSVKGVLNWLYLHGDNRFAYYERDQPAFYYDESSEPLKINVLFKTEEKALEFQSLWIHGSISSMKDLKISAQVTSGTFQLGNRIFSNDYIPIELDLLEEPLSVVYEIFSTFDNNSDEFKYQRIEKLEIFGPIGKAESCHLISASDCQTTPESYGEYDNDPNNRLAMSRDLHGWYAQLNTVIPLFNLKIVSISDTPVFKERYKVILAVVAYNQESADLIFWRLIEGSTKTDNPLIMHTFVHMTKPDVFKACLEWKQKQIAEAWEEFLSIYSEIP